MKIKRVPPVNSSMNKRRRNLVICVDNEGYLASVELRKIYISLADTSAKKHGYARVIDESGEDYLYPSAMFVPAVLPDEVRRAVLRSPAGMRR